MTQTTTAQSPPTDIADRWFTVEQITECWPVKRRMVYDAIARAELRAARLGTGRRKLVIRGAWVTEWFERASVEITR